MEIKRIEENDRIGEFLNFAFSEYAADCDVALNFEEFCFVAEDDGKIAGVITGRAYYNEVHIGDLIVGKAYRRLTWDSNKTELYELNCRLLEACQIGGLEGKTC